MQALLEQVSQIAPSGSLYPRRNRTNNGDCVHTPWDYQNALPARQIVFEGALVGWQARAQ